MIGFGSTGVTCFCKGADWTGRETLAWTLVGAGFVVPQSVVFTVVAVET